MWHFFPIRKTAYRVRYRLINGLESLSQHLASVSRFLVVTAQTEHSHIYASVRTRRRVNLRMYKIVIAAVNRILMHRVNRLYA